MAFSILTLIKIDYENPQKYNVYAKVGKLIAIINEISLNYVCLNVFSQKSKVHHKHI